MHSVTPAHIQTTLGDLVAALFDAFVEEYGDEELAEVATSTLVAERLIEGDWQLDAEALVAA